MALTTSYSTLNNHRFTATLPGPTRKRLPSSYWYEIAFRDEDPLVVGCALIWHVHGGRSRYQIALERTEQ